MTDPTISTSIQALLAIALLAVPLTSAADMGVPAVRATTLIEMGSEGAPNAVVSRNGQVVFKNQLAASTRIVLAAKDAEAFDCVVDGDRVTRSRASQYLLRGGAELNCVVQPGSYRYLTMTQQRGGVHKARATLRVRN